MHNMVLLSAIEKEHQNAMEDFEGFMLSCAEADWEKHQATHGFAGVGGYGGSGGGFTPMDTASLLEGPSATTPAAGGRGLFADGTTTPAKPPSAPFARLGGERPEAYLAATKALNSARLQGGGISFNAVAAFADAAATTGAGAGAGSAMQSSIGSCWALLRAMMGEAGGGAAQPASLVSGARRHLEAGHAAYMLDVVRKHAQLARLGGDTAALAQVHAFLRVRLHGQGALDLDAEAGAGGVLNTTWRQVYYCVRSGYTHEALAVARAAEDPAVAAAPGVDLVTALQEWVNGGGVVAPATAAAMAQQATRMLKADPRSADKSRPHLLALYVLLSGDAQCARDLMVVHPTFFGYLQDFMWFQLAMVRVGGGGAAAAAGAFTVSDLQAYLRQYPAAHYSRDGREPLLYVTVLLLSLQVSVVATPRLGRSGLVCVCDETHLGTNLPARTRTKTESCRCTENSRVCKGLETLSVLQ